MENMDDMESMDRPAVTLFMLASLDGKIASRYSKTPNTAEHWEKIPGVREGLFQYFEAAAGIDEWTLCTGRVMEQNGINLCEGTPEKSRTRLILIDNRPHLSKQGVEYLCQKTKDLYVVTENRDHPAILQPQKNLHVLYYKYGIDFHHLFRKLRAEYGVERLTVRAGGTLNSDLLRMKLLDYVDVILAPLLVGGSDTPTMVDGSSIFSEDELYKLAPLELTDCTPLKHSYLRLRYRIRKEL